jgi:pilus assembly protein CpaB
MRPKSLALLMLALGCGLVASIGITEVISRRNAEPSGALGDTKGIFVAMTDIGLGDQLTAQVLKLEQWPKDKVPPGAILRIEDVEGRRARTKLYAGEPILENRLLGKGASEQGATALIPKGYRVVPVKVDLVSGGSSLILPGDRVDVMVHLVKDPGRDIRETVTRTILQDIKVFAVDNIVDLEKDKDGNSRSISAKTISLLVTPEQAATVMLATQMGVINLVMRSPEDDQQGANAEARPSELLGIAKKSKRDKESLLASSESNLNEKTKGFLDFLNTMKAKTPAATPDDEAKTWNMRILKPGNVEDVQFKVEKTTGATPSPLGAWKSASLASSAGPAAAVEAENITADPPSHEEPQPPIEQPKRDKTD